jgi:hypothetical protein
MGGDVALTVEGKPGVGEEQSQLSMSLSGQGIEGMRVAVAERRGLEETPRP